MKRKLGKLVRFEPWPDEPLITINRRGVFFTLGVLGFAFSPFLFAWIDHSPKIESIAKYLAEKM